MKYQANFSTINSLFDSIARGLGNYDKYFYKRKSFIILEDVLMYVFCFYNSYKEVVSALHLDENYSI